MAQVSRHERELIEQALASDRPPSEPGAIIVVLPDTAEFEQLAESALWPALAENGFRRSGIYPFDSGSTLADIARSIRSVDLLVADLTGPSPDVMYALGLAHGLGRCPILLSQNPQALPAALDAFRCIKYANHHAGRWTLRQELARAIRVFVAEAGASGE